MRHLQKIAGKAKAAYEMSAEERTREFNKLFDAIPLQANVDKINFVCELVCVKPNTVRIWRMETPPRSPSELVLKVMRENIQRTKNAKPHKSSK